MMEDINIEPSALKDADIEKGTQDVSSTSRVQKDQDIVEKESRWDDWWDFVFVSDRKVSLPGSYMLVTDEKARDWSINVLRYAVFASAINTKMLNPNFAIMASPEAHEDSFESTAPFDFNSATYFIPMCTLLGVAISSIFVGGLSDRIGRKRVMLVMAIVSTIGSVVRYLCRNSFWAFNAANFIVGFFLANLPVAMAYLGDVFHNKEEKGKQLGTITGCFVMGNSGGGMIAILMESTGLFTPLLVGAGLMAIATVLMFVYILEPGDSRMAETKTNFHLETDDDDDDIKRPEEINRVTLWNIVGGALLDNIGSTGLFPLCLSPLALQQYYGDFAAAGQTPIMSLTGYKWLSVCVALMVVPSTLITPQIFKKIGIAATCVMGNILTACLTIALLAIGNGPATSTYFIIFVVVMYGGFPFTVFSQLTTGPMLDIIAPEDKIGYVQGLNNMAMNFGMAFAPWVLGILADTTSTNTAIWTGIGISFGAALCNVPLMFRPGMGRPVPKEPAYRRVLAGEDNEIAQQALDGEYIPPELLFEINRQRILKNKPVIIPKVKSYQEEKESLPELQKNAGQTFRFRMGLGDRILSEVGKKDGGVSNEELCELLNVANQRVKGSEESQRAVADIGQWVGEYLADVGYNPDVNPVLVKQMILTAFPAISRDEAISPENLEENLLKYRQVMNQYMRIAKSEESSRYTVRGILSAQPSQIGFYS